MSFDVLAPCYRAMETVLAGPRLQRARNARLQHVRDGDRILIAGAGHGPFLETCIRRFPAARITAVDASAAMLKQARRRLGRAAMKVHWIHARLPEWRPDPEAFDVIATHFFLDCFPPDELRRVIAALARGATSQGRWLIADFAIPERGWRRQRARAIHAAMYFFFRRATALAARSRTEPDAMLAEHGFRLAGRITSEWGLLQSDSWQRVGALTPPDLR